MTDRVLMGEFAPGDFRLRVSAPGFDVLDPNLERDQLIFDSTWKDSPKVIMSGVTQAPYWLGSDTSAQPIEIPFGRTLSYFPICFSFVVNLDEHKSHSRGLNANAAMIFTLGGSMDLVSSLYDRLVVRPLGLSSNPAENIATLPPHIFYVVLDAKAIAS